MTLKLSLLSLLVLLLPWLLLNCTEFAEWADGAPPVTALAASVIPPSQPSSRYTVQYDLYFKHWGEFYFPFEEWKWWKAQGIAESNLDPRAVSWCGAQGIMQIMPKTGVGLGLKDPWNPEDSIQKGIKYDLQCDKYFKDIIQPDRRKFMFAGYNAGMGNINKARIKARTDYWDDAAIELCSVTGKANCAETTGYVDRIHKLKGVI
jgi:membrane-bound lytic murein transglycosylase MltF